MGLLGSIGDFFGGKDAEKYDNTTTQAKDARTIGRAKHTFDVGAANAGPGQTAQGQQLNTTNYDQVRGQQQGVLGQLTGQAAGQGPSAAAMAGASQRDANLQQAAALQGGRRGQGAGVGIRAAGNQVTAGNQQAAQTQAIGQANEMQQARQNQVGLLGQIAGNDISVSGQNAQMGQQNAQFNAGQGNQMSQFNANLGQNAALANQQAQLGIANTELQQRARQEGLSYSNLEPGTPGLLSPQNVATGIGAAVAFSDEESKESKRRVDGTYGRAMSPVDAKYGIRPTQPGAPTMQLPGLAGSQGGPYMAQPGGTIGPNSRVTPNWYVNSPAAYGNAIGSVLSNAALQKSLDANSKKKGGESADDGGLGIATESPYSQDAGGGDTSSKLLGLAMQHPELLAALSDRRSKEDPEPVSRGEAREMFEKAPAYSYFYKPDAREAGAPPGRQTSVMWDDLQKSEAGRRMDGGREPNTGYHTVDYLKGLPAAFASLSDLNDRLARIEKGKGGR